MINTHRLDGLDMAPAILEPKWVVTIDSPKAGVDQVTAALGEHVDEGTLQRTAASQIEFSIPPDLQLLGRVFDVVFAAHVNEEPTIRVHEAFGSRSKLLDDRDNPNRYWNRPDADQLHGAIIGTDA